MKNIIGVALAVAFVIVLGAFVGLGFGVGALGTGIFKSGNPDTAYEFSYAESGQWWGDGLSYHVDLTTINQSGSPMVTALLAGHQSTAVTFGSVFYSAGDCGTTGQPALVPGTGADYAYYMVSLDGNSFTGTLDGQAFATTTALPISQNASGLILACGKALRTGHDEVFPSVLGNIPNYAPSAFQHTLVLSGQYPQATLRVALNTQVTLCGNPNSIGGGTIGAVCIAVNSAGAHVDSDGGGVSLSSVASTKVQSGYGTVTVTNPGNIVGNGGTVSIVVASGYAGPSGWTVSLLCPIPRTTAQGGCNGGQNDSRFASQNVGNDCSACPVSWTVPSGTSQVVNTTGWNTWEVELYNGLFKEGYAPVTINLLPPTSPSTPLAPHLLFSTSGKFYYPQPGDTLTLTIYANVSQSSGPIQSIMLWLYYLQPGGNPVNEPGCGSFWITTSCPYGTTLGAAQIQSNGANGLIGTYSFTVTPPSGTTQIGILVESFVAGQQGSPIVPYLLQITPHDCTLGTPGCAGKTGIAIWAVWGPILFSALLIIGGLLVAFWVPLPLLLRAGAVIVPVVAVALLYLLGIYGVWFHPNFA